VVCARYGTHISFNWWIVLQAENWLLVKLSMISSGMFIYVINVYMPNNYREKLDCWDSLLSLENGDFSHNCILAGDFNITRTLKEKRGGSIVRDQFRENLDDVISTLELYDVPPKKGSFTWNNRRAGLGHIAARLDRFLISSSFLSSNGSFSSQILPWESSDHRPISLVYESEVKLGSYSV
jgi:endonuclease/exonuclease/phosphatase family metal-dependent hydrolase